MCDKSSGAPLALATVGNESVERGTGLEANARRDGHRPLLVARSRVRVTERAAPRSPSSPGGVGRDGGGMKGMAALGSPSEDGMRGDVNLSLSAVPDGG